jgi:hypothetical protein
MAEESFLDSDSGEEKKLLTAAEVLQAEDADFVDVDVSQWWGGTIRIRALTAKEAITFTKLEQQESMIMVVSRCAIDEDGNRLFTDKQVEKLKTKSFAAFIKIQKAAMKLNGLSTETVKND